MQMRTETVVVPVFEKETLVDPVNPVSSARVLKAVWPGLRSVLSPIGKRADIHHLLFDHARRILVDGASGEYAIGAGAIADDTLLPIGDAFRAVDGHRHAVGKRLAPWRRAGECRARRNVPGRGDGIRVRTLSVAGAEVPRALPDLKILADGDLLGKGIQCSAGP